MTDAAIGFMVFGWVVAFGMLGFCIYKVVQSNNSTGASSDQSE